MLNEEYQYNLLRHDNHHLLLNININFYQPSQINRIFSPIVVHLILSRKNNEALCEAHFGA